MKHLIDLSNEYGQNPEFVLAGGGNTSLKEDGFLFVKGSGTTLADITETGFVKMELSKLAAIMQKKYSADLKTREAEVLEDLMNARAPGETKRPSVETSLHALMPFRYVVHLHPALVNGLTCAAEGRAHAEKLFGKTFLWIDICEPGYTLAVKVRDALNAYRTAHGSDCKLIFLKNHGVFVAGDTPDDVRKTYAEIMAKLQSAIKRQPDLSPDPSSRERAAQLAPPLRALLGKEGRTVRFESNGETKRLLADKSAFAPLSGAYTPDHIVYCRAFALFVPYAEEIETQYKNLQTALADYLQKYGVSPRLIAVEKTGVFVAGKNAKAANTSAALLLDELKIACYAESFGGFEFMPEYYVDFIVNWEVESYRAKQAAAAGAGRADGKTVIVTGSAQGFGQGIAEDFFKEGANVVIADLNDALAREVAEKCNANKGANRAIAVKCDVTDENSVKTLLEETVLAFGGLDVYVNNAGIVRAGSLEELTLSAFDLVTKVNYTAYFLGVKYASAVMKLEHRFSPETWFDIVQINSKSGLSGSNKNFAYAGSKFGGIGLTQSFALELIPYRIKVNSVCPGNFLDGPLWTDPEKGLFVQYFKANKVPGAKSVEDVRKFYESKVPAGRGCQTADVMRAVYYAIEQVYETGQAIPVTGGQNMLN